MLNLDPVADYYTKKLREFGAENRGVDWSSSESQVLRFNQLTKLFTKSIFSVCDLGCGYGAFYDHIRGPGVRYSGLDISEEMIKEAAKKHPLAEFSVGSSPKGIYHYCVASGIFNVRLEAPDDLWRKHILDTVIEMHSHSLYGFAFNCLTRFSDEEKKKGYLYYADPCELFEFCKGLSLNVALLHDYELYEFTILVRK